MGKLMNVRQVAAQIFIEIKGLLEEWRECIGDVEDSFVAFIWGDSANGKTSFIAQLLKELSKVGGSILYLSYEEGHGKTVKKAIDKNGLLDLNLQYLDHATYEELLERLKKKKSAKIVVIDSWQYCRFTLAQYQELKRLFVMGKGNSRRKIFLIISHASGKEPLGRVAQSIRYDANIKIFVKGFIAFIESRYGSVKNFIIWEQRAKSFWGKSFWRNVYKLKSDKEIKAMMKTEGKQLEVEL